jgi:fluoroacetyl-CoA thioesterase
MGTVVVGLRGMLTHEVTAADSAVAWGNDVPVLATPILLWLAELACCKALEPALASDRMTVGAAHAVRHLAPTPIGVSITVYGELLDIDGAHLRFRVWASDGIDVILEGTHDRGIVERERFVARVKRKAAAQHHVPPPVDAEAPSSSSAAGAVLTQSAFPIS